jgi:Mg-chelatase subunit ChlD
MEETGKNFFDSTSTTTDQPAAPQVAQESQPGGIPAPMQGRMGGATELKLTDTPVAAAGQPAAPASPASGPSAGNLGAFDLGVLPANGAVSDRERLSEGNRKFEDKLAEAKQVTDSLKQRTDDVQAQGGMRGEALEALNKKMSGTTAFGDAPVLGSLFGIQPTPEPGARAGAPVPVARPSTPGLIAGRAEAAGEKPPPPTIPRLPDVAGRTVAGASIDAAEAARDKSLSTGVPLDKTPAGGAGASEGRLAGGVALKDSKPQSETPVRKPAEMAAGDVAALAAAEADRRSMEAAPAAVTSKPEASDVLQRSGVDPANPVPADSKGPKSRVLRERLGRSFQSTDELEVTSEDDEKKLLLDADGLADTGRLDLAQKRYDQVLALDPNNHAAREGKEKLDLEREHYADAAYNETRGRLLWQLKSNWAEPVRQFENETKLADDFSNSAQPEWYFKQDGTLAKLAGKVDAGGIMNLTAPAQEPAKDSLARVPEKPIVFSKEVDAAVATPKAPALQPQPDVATSANAFSTFSLNVSDVAFKLAAASLEQGKLPDPGTLRSEEFINAFDYRDPEPTAGAPLAFATERSRYPFAQNRDLLRFSIKTAAVGRQAGRPLNLVLLVDNSGSMERADRVRILRESLRVLAAQLQPQDKLSIITFARTPHLWIDGVPGNQAAEATARVSEITPQGGTNLSAALDLAYETARKYYQVANINRVVLLTDGAANLGDVNPAALKQKVEAQRKQGIALDCFGVGWEGYNDDLLEQLSRNGDGRYGFINSPDAAASEFAGQLAGALRVAASDVKVQVEFNPKRVTAYRQIGYAKHQLTKEQFRDNTVDAAEIGAAESGNALYVVEVNPRGEGDLATVRARFKVPGTSDYREQEWTVPFSPNTPALEQASPAMRLAGTASAFSEMLAGSPYATEVTSDQLLGIINGIPQTFGTDPRPQKLEWMIRQAKSLSGR